MGGPTLTSVHIQSSNFRTEWVTVGDTITLTFTGSEDLQNVSVTIATHAVTPTGGPASWTATYTMQASDSEGTVPFTIDFENLSGDPGPTVSATTDESQVTFDQTAPSAPSMPDLMPLSDTGRSDIDDVTNTGTPLFSGTADADATEVLLYRDGGWERTDLVTGGTWQVGVNAALSDGTYSMTARVADLAGNLSDASDALSVIIDRTAPAGSGVDLDAGSDTGKSDSDNITRGENPVFSGLATDSGTSASGVWKVELWSDDGKTGSDADGTYYSVALSTLDEGFRTVSGRVHDVAGNTYDLGDCSMLVDRTEPTGTTPDLAAGSDTGDSNIDNITDGIAPRFTGTASDPAVAGVSSGVWKVEVVSDDATSATDSDGTYYDVTLGTLSEGSREVSATVTDVAGNTHTTSALSVTADRTAPAAPSTPDLTTASDAGQSNSDDITNEDRPMFEGTAAADATQALLFVDGGWESTELVSDGEWLVGVGLPLSDGTYGFTAKVTDAAGNLSVASGGLSVTIDTTAPGLSNPDLSDASDTGKSNTDGITKAVAPLFTGLASDGESGLWKVVISGDDGTSATDDESTYYSASLALTEGFRTVSAMAYDVAGNTKTSGDLSVWVDRSAPTGSVPDLAAASDTGQSNVDDLTQGTTPQFVGTAGDGASGVWKVVVSSDDGKSGTDDDGTYYAVTLATLNEGNRSIAATVHDVAGNTYGTGALGIAVDRTASMPKIAVSQTVINDAVASAGSFTVTVTFGEAMDPAATPTLVFDPTLGVTTGAAPTLSGPAGNWDASDTYTVTYSVADQDATIDPVTIDVTDAVDAAGNAQQDYLPENEFSIDTGNPSPVEIGMSHWDEGFFRHVIRESDAGGQFEIDMRYDESLDPSNEPTITFSPSLAEAGETLDFVEFRWSAEFGANSRVTAVYNIIDVDDTQIGVDVTISGLTDVAGNPITNDGTTYTDSIDVDTAGPTVQSTAVSDTLITDDDDGALFEIEFTLSETIKSYDDHLADGDPLPTIAFSPDLELLGTLTLPDEGWGSAGNVFGGAYTIDDVDETALGVDAIVHGILDLYDNPLDPHPTTSADAFDVDTENPSVKSISVNDAQITDADTPGDGTFVVTIEFDEPMDQLVAPTLTFAPTVATTLWPHGDGTGWADEGTYIAVFDVADGGVDVDSVTIDVEGAQDVVGNGQQNFTPEHEFEIDTLNPWVANVTVDTNPVYEGDLTQQVTVTYSEPIDMAVIPSIGFSHGSWDEDEDSRIWASFGTVFIVTYVLTDNDEEFYDWTPGVDVVAVDVTGAMDEAGNAQDDYAPQTEFDLDTKCPTITSITSATPDGYYGLGEAIDVTINFSEVATLLTGRIAVLLDSGASPIGFYAPMGPAASISETYTVGAGDNSCDLDAGFIVLYSDGQLVDVAGNITETVSLPGTTIADGSEIAVDTTDPTIAWIVDFPDTTQDMDADCSLSFPIEIQVTDNCCLDAADIVLTLTGPPNVTATSDWTVEQTTETQVDITGTVTVSNLTSCPATVDLDIDAEDCTGNTSTSGDSVTVSDLSAPTLTWIIDLPDTAQSMDEDCSLTLPVEMLVEDNCCIVAGGVDITLTDAGDVTVADTLTKTQEGANAVRITGDVTLSALTDGEATVDLDVDATDCCNNTDSTNDAMTTVDDARPTISGFTVTPDDGLVDAHCEEVVTVSAVVHDNCCLAAGNVVVTPSVTNASLKDNTITVTQSGQDEVIVSGTIVVHSLIGCPATLGIEIDATDCGGNHDEWTEDAQIEDDIIPGIHDLRVDEHVLVSDCCEAVVTFDGYVTDNCCVLPSGIAIAVTHPTGNATVGYVQATDVELTQAAQGRVDFAGEIAVRCLTSCPAEVVVTVNANDCCGNPAATVVSVPDPTDPEYNGGDVYDETLPIPRDDPRQDLAHDGSAVIDPLVGVYEDSLGVVRLTLREDTPVRINVLANDADNCSCEDCVHPFDPCGGCGDCPGCCAAMFLDEIVSPPAYGTATVEEAAGDCGGGSLIRFAPDRGRVGPDEFTYRTRDACGNVSDVIATVYVHVVEQTVVEEVFPTTCIGQSVTFTVTGVDLWVDGGDPGRIPSVFSVVSAPAHGVLAGDLGEIVYGTSGALGTATIELTYTAAAGYTGRDTAIVRFADPFDGFTDAPVSYTHLTLPTN